MTSTGSTGLVEGVPVLGSADLKVELQNAYRQRRQHHLHAFFGTGVEGSIDVDDSAVRVVPVRSEIELREKMPPLSATQERIAYLVGQQPPTAPTGFQTTHLSVLVIGQTAVPPFLNFERKG